MVHHDMGVYNFQTYMQNKALHSYDSFLGISAFKLKQAIFFKSALATSRLPLGPLLYFSISPSINMQNGWIIAGLSQSGNLYYSLQTGNTAGMGSFNTTHEPLMTYFI